MVLVNKIKQIKLSKENITITGLFMVLITIGLICSKAKHDDVKKNGQLMFVTVEEITLTQYGYPDFHVTYEFKGEIYKESRSFANISYNKSKTNILGKKVGIVFSKINPSNVEILISPSSFENVGLKMPDSTRVLFEKIKSSW